MLVAVNGVGFAVGVLAAWCLIAALVAPAVGAAIRGPATPRPPRPLHVVPPADQRERDSWTEAERRWREHRGDDSAREERTWKPCAR